MTKRIKLKMGHQYQCYVKCVIGRWNRLDNCWCTHYERKLLKWNHWHSDLVESLTLANLIVSISAWRSAKQANLTLHFTSLIFPKLPFILYLNCISACAPHGLGAFMCYPYLIFLRVKLFEGKLQTLSFYKERSKLYIINPKFP